MCSSLGCLWGAFAIVGQALADGFERGVVNGEAVADDAMTAATNPAGMAFLDRTQALAMAQVASEYVQFKSDGNNTASGGDGGEAGKPFAPGAGLFSVYKANPDLGLRLSFTSPLGGGASYDRSSPIQLVQPDSENYEGGPLWRRRY